MSSKRDNRKMVDILERMGMIKKVEDEMESNHSNSTSSAASYRPGTSSALDIAALEARVAAAQQSAPTNNAEASEPRSTAASVSTTAVQTPEPPRASMPMDAARFAPAADRAAPSPVTYPARGAAPAQGDRFAYSDLNVSTDYSFDRNLNVSEAETSFWSDEEPQAPNLEQYLDIDKLYQMFNLQPTNVDTIFLVEEYIKTLPESLPEDLRRSIITRIVNASGFDFDRLLSDGIERVTRLNEYAGSFSTRTNEIVGRLSEEIEALEAQIERVRESIDERVNLHKKQFLTIENEAQRLKEVLDFITK